MSEPSAKRRKIANQDGTRITDPRFANIQSDPRYRLPGKKQKVKLDKRFTQKLKNEDFTRRAKVDRYGRPVQDDAVQRRLREKFDLEEDESSDEPDDDDEVQKELARIKKSHDPLRDGKIDADSSSDESSTDEDSDSDVEDIEEAELATSKEEVPEGEVSTRIAIVNLDWDNIRAEDLMAVFSSFVPATGRLLNVTVYPSEFGRERMEREEMEGPPKEIFAANKTTEDIEDSDEEMEEDDEDIKASIIKPDDGSEFDSQALRQYQLERLRYFYAVLKFSNKASAKAIYDAVDGTEYLSTANFFDLRFVPEEMDFSDDKPRDQCDHLPTGYKPNEFVTDALQHSKVKLTWDQEDRTRKEAQARAFKGGQKEIDENDLKAYLASDGSDEEDDEVSTTFEAEPATSKKEQERQKARALLGLAPEPTKKSKKSKNDPVGDIQITFSSGLAGQADDETAKKRSVFENSPEPQETTVEKYIRKEKERKQRRKEKMKGNNPDPDEAETAEAEPTTEELGFEDPFFNDETLNDPSLKNKQRKEARLKKRAEREAEEKASAKQRAELELLMAEDENDTAKAAGVTGKGRTVQHFDMAEIEKAEKRKSKKDKFRKKGQKEADEKVLQDDFKMDTADPRFGKLFESHEFAIDPTNSKVRATKGMQELVEERRRRKQKGEAEPVSVSKDELRKQKKKSEKAEASNSSDVKDLVAKIKRKAA